MASQSLPAPTTLVGQATSLSPSRAADFQQCPLLYRFRVIDKIPEKPSSAATRGTLVHAVLDKIFDEPCHNRTADRAIEQIQPRWDELLHQDPELLELFPEAEPEVLAQWLTSAEALIQRWFTLEDPTRLEPAEREFFIQCELESGLTLRGFVDRLDISPAGDLRIVDYKTGKSPNAGYEQKALFQMKFYALVMWRTHGNIPKLLQLVYLGDGKILRYSPTESDLEATERKILAIWAAIREATASGQWLPKSSRLCDWCSYRALCPAWGGVLPELPSNNTETATNNLR